MINKKDVRTVVLNGEESIQNLDQRRNIGDSRSQACMHIMKKGYSICMHGGLITLPLMFLALLFKVL